MVLGKGVAGRLLSEGEIREVVAAAMAQEGLAGKRVLFIIPDGTRTAPMPLLFRLLTEQLLGRVAALDFLIALGTHLPMTEEAILKLVGIDAQARKGRYGGVGIFNHEWSKPETFKLAGRIPREEIRRISNGLLDQAVDVTVNKMLWNYDRVIICGPVFPHEVAGFSGGNKYFFPGVAGKEVINLTHWLGALITNYQVIGTKHTPIRAVIDRAATFIDVPRRCLSLVVKGQDLAGLYYGSPEEAWSAAADLSAREHVLYVERPYRTILSVMPAMYQDLWTAGKGMYKLEPVAADGGEVIIYAPHIDEISYSHGHEIRQIGYHCRDYFVKQWERFKDFSWGVLAHSTHVRGMGSYENGVEKPRVAVTLATRIPESVCRSINLGYRDPATIDPAAFEGKEAQGVLLVRKAGEMLYRIRDKENH